MQLRNYVSVAALSTALRGEMSNRYCWRTSQFTENEKMYGRAGLELLSKRFILAQ
jgi:hypothetical protein